MVCPCGIIVMCIAWHVWPKYDECLMDRIVYIQIWNYDCEDSPNCTNSKSELLVWLTILPHVIPIIISRHMLFIRAKTAFKWIWYTQVSSPLIMGNSCWMSPMMTSWDGNVFRVTGRLWGVSTGPEGCPPVIGGFPAQRTSNKPLKFSLMLA